MGFWVFAFFCFVVVVVCFCCLVFLHKIAEIFRYQLDLISLNKKKVLHHSSAQGSNPWIICSQFQVFQLVLCLKVPSFKHGISVFSGYSEIPPTLFPVHFSVFPISPLQGSSLHNYCLLCTSHQYQKKPHSSVSTLKFFLHLMFLIPEKVSFFCARPGNQNSSHWLRPSNARRYTNALYKEIPPNSKECIGILHKTAASITILRQREKLLKRIYKLIILILS